MRRHLRLRWLLVLGVMYSQGARSQLDFSFVATMTGEQAGDGFFVVSNVRDLNGDGFDDVVVGATAESSGKGNYAKLYFGGTVFDTVADMRFSGVHFNEGFGFSVAGGGDLNGDGYSDFVIGAPHSIVSGMFSAGMVYLYWGGPAIDTVADLRLSPGRDYFQVGWSLAIVGDINGDGIDDLLVGAPSDALERRGRAYLYLGGVTMDTIPDAMFEGDGPFDMMGYSVSGAGDVNGDGMDDFLVGAPEGSDPPYTGYARLYFGSVDPSNLQSMTLPGDTAAKAQFGRLVTDLSDINGDGFSDFAVMGLDRTCVFLGAVTPPSTLAITFWKSGYISPAGDINTDGFDDFVFVSDSLGFHFGSTLLDTLADLNASMRPRAIRLLGDVNGDHRPDFAAAAAHPNGSVQVWTIDVIDAVNEGDMGANFRLHQNYPNPFNGETSITFTSDETHPGTIEVFSLLGQRVAVIIDGIIQQGTHTVRFDGRLFASGVYVCRLSAGPRASQIPMILLK